MRKPNIPGGSQPNPDLGLVPETSDSDATDCPLCKKYNVPNAETLAAVRELAEGGRKEFATIEAMMRDLSDEAGAAGPASDDD